MHLLTRTISAACLLLLIIACKKNDSPPVPVDFSVNNRWQCDIDGLRYSGTVDTSFAQLTGQPGSLDTILFFTGTSEDKKANIHFELWINRTGWGHDSVQMLAGGNRFTFDTSGKNYWVCGNNVGQLVFKIDGFTATKMKGRFYGSIRNMTSIGAFNLQVTNGVISLDVGRGNSELKNFSCLADNNNVGGYIKYARHISNTLIFDGFSFTGDSIFQMKVRTGSTLKTGSYESRKGEVGFSIWRPSIFPFYVNDTLGNLNVTIDAVNGNIIEGRFSGIATGFSSLDRPIANGKFRCRVRDYQPQSDSAFKWGFSETNGTLDYNIYGGNVINPNRQQVGNRYLLTVSGESDNLASNFKIVLSSSSPLTTGLYQTGSLPNRIDSFYFNSASASFFTEDFRSGAYCQLDSLDSQKAVGRIYGTIYLRLGPGAVTPVQVLKSYFRAKF